MNTTPEPYMLVNTWNEDDALRVAQLSPNQAQEFLEPPTYLIYSRLDGSYHVSLPSEHLPAEAIPIAVSIKPAPGTRAGPLATNDGQPAPKLVKLLAIYWHGSTSLERFRELKKATSKRER